MPDPLTASVSLRFGVILRRKLRDDLRTARSKELLFMKSGDFSSRGKSNVVDLLSEGSFMKSIGLDRKSARFSKFNYILQAAAIGGAFLRKEPELPKLPSPVPDDPSNRMVAEAWP